MLLYYYSHRGLALHKGPCPPTSADKTKKWNSWEGKAQSRQPRSSKRSMENIFFAVFYMARALSCWMGRNEPHTQELALYTPGQLKVEWPSEIDKESFRHSELKSGNSKRTPKHLLLFCQVSAAFLVFVYTGMAYPGTC